MRYTLRQLEVFLATAGHENISRAAKSLAMSQSAASGSLKELEQQFDVQLFDRVGKRLQLSELGRQLRPAAERLLAQAQAFEGAMAGEDITGRLRIGGHTHHRQLPGGRTDRQLHASPSRRGYRAFCSQYSADCQSGSWI